MALGIVKWFNDSEGFGFLEQSNGGEDVFIHHSAISTEGYRTLREGEQVEFQAVREAKGLRATSVKLVDESEILEQIEELRTKVKLFDFSSFYLRVKQGEEKESVIEVMINTWAARMQRRIISTSMSMTADTLFVMVTHEPAD